jgi:hypothetical protein
MSVKGFLSNPSNAARLKTLRPPPPRIIGAPVRILSRSNRHTLIGAAFDYLLRFEIKRRAPRAEESTWVAAHSLRLFFGQTRQPDGVLRSRIPDALLAPFVPVVERDSLEGLPERLRVGIGGLAGDDCHSSLKIAQRIGIRAMKIISDALAAYKRFVEERSVVRSDLEEMARSAVRLTKIEIFRRTGLLEPTLFSEPLNDDIEELIELLEIVPFDSLLNQERLILNPTFGESSRRFGGADSDLISGDMLIDFKVTKNDSIQVVWLDQLLCYYLLARHERTQVPAFPEIRRLSLYFARHGCLAEVPVSKWVDHPEFADTEKWFVANALKPTMHDGAAARLD